MSEFWKLFKESVILQAVLTLMVWSVILYMLANGQEVGSELWSVGSLIIGFYFGSKVEAWKRGG